jgi:protein phosphatase
MYKGQKLLLCSDGLTDEVDDEVIASILASSESEQEKVDQLLKKALSEGGSDNITIILIAAPDSAPERLITLA